MRDPTKKGNIAYEAGRNAAYFVKDQYDDSIDWGNPLDVEAVGDGFLDGMDEVADADAEDRRNA